jgi:predicted nucleotidyltransferase component of viral defense system
MAPLDSEQLAQRNAEMIDKREIDEVGRALGIESRVVEKDYILGWLLAGIGNHPKLKDSWVFKGGTCLKKCFFETYRFSEDLDFTISDRSHLSEEFLRPVFEEIGGWVYEASGVELPTESFIFEVLPERAYVQGRIGYRGPLKQGTSTPKVKLDLVGDELIALNTVMQAVHHPYTDLPAGGIRIRSYPYEEVFAEKVRALAERCRPRDLYDVIHLYRNQHLLADRSALLPTLEKKCRHKSIAVPDFKTIENHRYRGELESEWSRMLKHQLAALPPIESLWKELPAFFDWLTAGKEPEKPASIATSDSETPWLPPPRFIGVASTSTGVIERIRMAGANRLCLTLLYSGKKRTIEPYSFRMNKDGALVFYGFERESDQIKCFTVAKIQKVEVTDNSFNPRYHVEIDQHSPIRKKR